MYNSTKKVFSQTLISSSYDYLDHNYQEPINHCIDWVITNYGFNIHYFLNNYKENNNSAYRLISNSHTNTPVDI